MKKINNLHTNYEDIAVIGMALKFPMADNPDEYWDIISKGKECIRSIPKKRKDDIDEALKALGEDGQDYVKGGFIDCIDEFDYSYFNISPTEANVMTPLQRLFLQTVTEAVDDSGYGFPGVYGSKTGVFVGYQSTKPVYSEMISLLCPDQKDISFAGNEISIIASRPAYFYDWKGPVSVIDNACASSISAIHYGCRSLQLNECEMAVAGGIALNMLPFKKDYKIGVESSDYKTRAFSDENHGTAGGEGVGVVILKTLDRALQDKDNIYAVIKGSCINYDGKTLGITMPNAIAQEEAIIKAWENAGINPENIVYIEAHGTGTKLGDPIEVLALKRAFERFTNRKQFCAIGSVKSNMGHLLGAAGIAGFIKTVLILNKRKIPATINIDMPNRNIAFYQSPVYPNDILKSINRPVPYYCGISSFGINGTNGHIVIEGPVEAVKDDSYKQEDIFTLSAETEEQLIQLLMKYFRHIKDNPMLSLNDLCYTTNISKRSFKYKTAIVAQNTDDLLIKIKYIINNNLNGNLAEHIFTYKMEIDRGSDTNIAEIENLLKLKKKQKKDVSYELSVLAIAYIKNIKVNWSNIYDECPVKKVKVPVYPLKRNRCWLIFNQTPNKAIIKKNEEDDVGFYYYKWIKCSGKNYTIHTKEKKCLLICNNKDDGQKIKELLKESNRKIKMLNCSEILNNGFYEALYQTLSDFSPEQIFLSFYSEKQAYENINLQSKANFISGLFIDLFAAISKLKETNISSVIALTYNTYCVSLSDQYVNSEDSMVHNIAKALRWEYPKINFRLFDLDNQTDLKVVISDIDNEFYEKDFITVYRENERYQQVIDEADKCCENGDFPLKKNGVYLIVGGLSEIGLNISKSIANICQSTIILSGRKMSTFQQWLISKNDINTSEMESWKQKADAINYIINKGCRIVFESCDITSIKDLESMQNRLESQNMTIDGIFHCAVETGGGNIYQATRETFDKVISPKYYGAYNLYNIYSKRPLDFIVFNSSAMTSIGEPGASMYLASNGYLDSIVYRFIQAGIQAYSVNWPEWKDTGISKGQSTIENKELFGILMPNQASKALLKIFHYPKGQLIIGKLNVKSELFLLGDYLPFKMSDRITGAISQEENIMQKESHLLDDISHSNILSEISKIVSEVLGFESIDYNKNFYDIGMDSIIAIKIINRILQRLNIQMKLSDFFSNLTVRSLTACIEEQYLHKNKEETTDAYTIKKAPHMEYYPVSSAQYRMYILNQISNDTTYNLTEAIEINGLLNIDKVVDALNYLIERHELLRTAYVFVDNNICQKIFPNIRLDFKHIESNTYDRKYIHDEFNQFIKPFDMSKPPLFRVLLLSFCDQKHVLLFDMHHIISDGKSHDIFVREFIKLYHGNKLKELSLQYKDYAVWQKNFSNSKKMKEEEQFWINEYSEIPLIKLPYDFTRPERHLFSGGVQSFFLKDFLYEKIKSIAKHNEVTIFMVLLSIYEIFLWYCTNQERIVIGTVVEGRFNMDLENLIGMFTNTLALDFRIDSTLPYGEFLKATNRTCMSFFDNQDYQFEDLVDKLKIKRSINRNPLFDVMFVLQTKNNEKAEIEGLSIKPFEKEVITAKFDLSLDAIDTGNAFSMTMFYMKDLFKADTIDYFCRLYIKIAELIVNDDNISLETIKRNLSEVQKKVETDDSFNLNFDIG